MKKLLLLGLAILCLVAFAVPMMAEDHPVNEPIKLAFDMGFVPYHYWSETGEAIGYGIEVSEEVARRLGRPGIKVIDTNWSGIFSGLFASQYEAVFFSVYITPERADSMDFTEPFMTTPEAMMVRAEDLATYQEAADLNGKIVGVSAGSTADGWATDNAATYGFTVLRYDKVDQVILALQTKRVDAAAANLFTLKAFADVRDTLKISFLLTVPADYGLGYRGLGMAFRIDDSFRDDVERVLEGMKLDGSLQAIHEKWFGESTPNDYLNLVFSGYGCPGVRGYKPDAYHQPSFGEE